MSMRPVSAVWWRTLGWTAVLLVAVAALSALADPVLGVFVLYAAIIVGGLSGVGINASPGFGIATLISGLAIGLAGTHYTSSTGLRPPHPALILNAFTIFAWPVTASLALLLLGILKRRAAP